MSSKPQSPTKGLHAPPPPEAPKESVVSRLLIAPLAFLSFILSLALIDYRNHSLRTHTHPPSTRYSRLRAFFHSLIFKRMPEESPYAYVKSPDAKEETEKKDGEPWHWHTKQRKMMKAEMDDAFKLRKSVMILLIFAGVGSAVFVGFALRTLRISIQQFGKE